MSDLSSQDMLALLNQKIVGKKVVQVVNLGGSSLQIVVEDKSAEHPTRESIVTFSAQVDTIITPLLITHKPRLGIST